MSTTSSVSEEDVVSETSSFCKLLRGKVGGLKPTRTKLIDSSGKISYFQSQGQEQITNEQSAQTQTFGFVVDTKPDLSVNEVLPWLYISSQDVPQDLSIMEKMCITHVVSLLPGFELNSSVKCFVKDHVVFDVYDEESFNFEESQVIFEIIKYIAHSKLSNSRNKVLVHCNAGLSRAPTVVMYYLMKQEGYTYEDAWSTVKSVRPNAKPNQGFISQLKSLKI